MYTCSYICIYTYIYEHKTSPMRCAWAWVLGLFALLKRYAHVYIFMCIYQCICTYMYRVHICTDIYIYVYISALLKRYAHIYMYIYIHIHIYIYIPYIYIYVYKCICTCILYKYVLYFFLHPLSCPCVFVTLVLWGEMGIWWYHTLQHAHCCCSVFVLSVGAVPRVALGYRVVRILHNTRCNKLQHTASHSATLDTYCVLSGTYTATRTAANCNTLHRPQQHSTLIVC